MGLPWDAIDQWLADLPPKDAAVAFAVAGLVTKGDPEGLAEPTDEPFVWWRFDASWLSEPASRALETPRVNSLYDPRGDSPVYLGGPPLLRVAVKGKVDFQRLSEHLLAVPRVDSVVLSAARSSQAPRQRAWNWPLRIGLVGVEAAADDVAEAVLHLGLGLNPQQVRVVDPLAQPSFRDVLLLAGDVDEAVRECRAHRLRANAVVVMDLGGRPPAVGADGEGGEVGTARRGESPEVPGADEVAPEHLASALAQLRQVTGATSASRVWSKKDDVLARAMRGSALADASVTDQAAAWLVGFLLLNAVHGYPWDAALTAASDRRALIAGELDPLAASDIKSISREMASSIRVEAEAMAEPPNLGVLASVVKSMSDVESLVDRGTFVHETAEGAILPPILESAEEALDEANSERMLLCEVNRQEGDQEGTLRPIVVGPNVVEVSIGRPRKGAESVAGFDFDSLFEGNQRKVRLTIVFVPQQPAAEAMTRSIVLPRAGDSRRAQFQWEIPADATRVEARIMVIHRNRLLQTALLAGEVGRKAQPVDMTLVRPDLNGLDDRRAFDLTLLVEGGSGAESLIAHGQSTTNVVRNEVGDLTDVHAISARMRALLDEESFAAGRRKKPNPEAMRTLLVALAQEGRHLHLRLLGLVEGLDDCEYLQLVTATPGWFMPLEFIYPHEPPDDDAQMCPDWLAGGEAKCGGECIVDDDTAVMCPGAFWGMSRVIERHYRGPRLAGGIPSTEKVDVLTSGEPTAARRRLLLDHPAVAASKRVSPADTQSVAEELGDDSVLCANWDEWVVTLKAQPRHLLALMPHTDKGTLEVGGDVEKSAKFASKKFLTGGHDVEPVVLLLGCHTAGSAEDPAGYASDALIHGAAIVVTSLSLLLNKHAAEFARRLVDELGSAGRKARPVATVMRQFRRDAVFAGFPTALAITAYGDSDWSV